MIGPVTEEQVKRFRELFKGLNRARGVWWPTKGLMETIREEPEDCHFREHLEGRVGVGVVPINDDGVCSWAVIDVDAHEDDWYVKIPDLQMAIEEFNLPLVTCQSKSMGAHLYLFLESPVKAAELQHILGEWVAMIRNATMMYSKTTGQALAHAKVEIFPKQKKLAPDQVGNWVNLPYFRALETNRFAYHSGKALDLDEFLALAESKKATKSQLVAIKPGHPDAPPCVQHLLVHGTGMGSRNNALFAIGTYLKKTGVEDVEEALLRINYDKAILPRALGKQEVATIARSVRNGSYNYRCNEEPLCGLCDRVACKTRKFGVGPDGPSKAYDAAMFGSLKKILTDPPRWILEVNGVDIEFATEQLLDYKQVRKSMLEKVSIVAPPMKAEDWVVILRTKNEQREEISAPDDAGPGAMIKALLSEFCRSVERTEANGQPKFGRKEDLLRGLPVTLRDTDTDEVFVYFRGVDFISMLKRKRAEEFKGSALWSILRQIGCAHDKMRVGTQIVQLWCKPFQPWNVTHEAPKPEEKF